jgi:hypothetical protein
MVSTFQLVLFNIYRVDEPVGTDPLGQMEGEVAAAGADISDYAAGGHAQGVHHVLWPLPGISSADAVLAQQPDGGQAQCEQQRPQQQRLGAESGRMPEHRTSRLG